MVGLSMENVSDDQYQRFAIDSPLSIARAQMSPSPDLKCQDEKGSDCDEYLDG